MSLTQFRDFLFLFATFFGQAAAATGGFEVGGQHASAEMRKPRRGRRERATVPEGTSTRFVSSDTARWVTDCTSALYEFPKY